jgi:hypothetical protein
VGCEQLVERERAYPASLPLGIDAAVSRDLRREFVEKVEPQSEQRSRGAISRDLSFGRLSRVPDRRAAVESGLFRRPVPRHVVGRQAPIAINIETAALRRDGT